MKTYPLRRSSSPAAWRELTYVTKYTMAEIKAAIADDELWHLRDGARLNAARGLPSIEFLV
jgi:hypothetical protein